MADTATSIWRDWETDGVPSSGKHKPKKQKIREWGTYLEGLATLAYTSGLVYATRAELYANLVPGANTPALVIGDPTPGYDGIYAKNGATLTGSWTRLGDVPGRQLIRVTDVGAGTANAVQFTSDLTAATGSGNVVYFGFIFEANTGTMTFSINGATAKPVLTASGQAMQAGYLTAGMPVWFVDDGTSYRLTSDIASSATVTAAEAAAAEALGAVPSLQFASIAALRLFDAETSAVTAFVQAYYAGTLDGGGPFILDAADTTTLDNGGDVIVDADGRRWKRPANPAGVMNGHEWGCVDDAEWRGGFDDPTGTDNLARIEAMIAAMPTTLNEVDGYLSADEGSWGAIGNWTTVTRAPTLLFPPGKTPGRTGVFGVSGKINRDPQKSLVISSGSDSRTTAFMSLAEVTDWKKCNHVIDYHPCNAIYTDPTGTTASGVGTSIGLHGMSVLRGGVRIVGQNNFGQFFRDIGIYGAPGNAFHVIDGEDITNPDWLFPGTVGGTYTVLVKTTSAFQIRMTSGAASGRQIKFVSTGTDFTYSGDTPTAGTFARIEIYAARSGTSTALIGVAVGSTSNLTDFASSGLKASFAATTICDGLGITLEAYDGDFYRGINNVHTVMDRIEIAHSYRGFVWESKTYVLARLRNFTFRGMYDASMVIDGYGLDIQTGHFMFVIDDEAPFIWAPCLKNAFTHNTFRKLNFRAEGGNDPYTGVYGSEPDANDFLFSGDVLPAADPDWKYHPARKRSILIGPRDPITGVTTPVSGAPSGAGVAHNTWESIDALGTTKGDTEYFLEVAVGGVQKLTFSDNSLGSYKFGVVKESAVAATYTPAEECLWAESNVIDGSTCCTDVPTGKQPIFSEGGQGWKSAHAANANVARRPAIGALVNLRSGINSFSTGTRWSLSNVTVNKDATDRFGTSSGAWTITRGAGSTATMTSQGVTAASAVSMELWFKEGTGGQTKIKWWAHKAGTFAHRYTSQHSFFVPDSTWRKRLLSIPVADPSAGVNFIIDLTDLAEGETVLFGDETWVWNTDNPPAQPMLRATRTIDIGSTTGGAVTSFVITSGAEAMRAGDYCFPVRHGLDLATYPLTFDAQAEDGQVRVWVGAHATANPGETTFEVMWVPKLSIT